MTVLQSELDDGALWLVLNRPDRLNAINRELGPALLSALDQATDDDGVRAVCVTGAGHAFCAGDDVESISNSYGGNHDNVPSIPGTRDTIYTRVVEAVYHCPKPVVVALNGVSAGAGTEIACAADIRLAGASARIGSGLVKVGQVGNAVALPRVVGPSRATEIYLTGRLVGADEALRIGLVHEVVADDRLAARARELTSQLAQSPTRAIGLYKQLLQRSWGQSPELGLRLQDDIHRRTLREVEDAREGIQAFLEKRAPHFIGR